MALDIDLFFAATHAAGFCIACLAALLSLIRTTRPRAGHWLTLFFVVFALSTVSTIAEILIVQMPQILRDVLRITSFVASFLIGPFLLFHLQSITGTHRTTTHPNSVYYHMVLPVLAALVGACFLLLPDISRALVFQSPTFNVMPLAVRTVAIGLTVLELLLYVQWLFTVALICREQTRHLNQLKQHFASTEGLERRWVTALAVILGSYSFMRLVDFILDFFGWWDLISRELDSTIVLFAVIFLACWGLRSPPKLDNASDVLARSTNERPSKYVKSALASDQTDRIARKLSAVMQKDRIYRDPNLTLTSLSKHIGVSTNYVSQTLNEKMEKSFFEFVSDHRIAEAIPMVIQADQTILAIAYEVGFNSRSAFYTAFKRKTGMTPSAYKAQNPLVGAVSL